MILNVIVYIIRFEIPVIDAQGSRKMDENVAREILTTMNHHAPNPQVTVVVLG